jgi:hypothetical protein
VPKHSLYRRIKWSPFVTWLPCVYMWHITIAQDFPPMQILGACLITTWFLLTVADFWTNHRFLDWLYRADEE